MTMKVRKVFYSTLNVMVIHHSSVQCRKPEVMANVFAEIKDMLEFLPVHLLGKCFTRPINPERCVNVLYRLNIQHCALKSYVIHKISFLHVDFLD